jgi:hypothetical protein
MQYAPAKLMALKPVIPLVFIELCMGVGACTDKDNGNQEKQWFM